MRHVLFGALACTALLITGCGSEAPEISDAFASPNPAAAGSVVNFNMVITDPDGLEDLAIEARLLSPQPAEIETPALPDAPDGADAVQLTLLLQLLPTAPAGDYVFEFVALDADGNASDPAEVDLVVE